MDECRGASGVSSVDALEDALDELAEQGTPFMERYLIGSSVDRRSGGQGVVQFARIHNAPDQVAIKFYTHVPVRLFTHDKYTTRETLLPLACSGEGPRPSLFAMKLFILYVVLTIVPNICIQL